MNNQAELLSYLKKLKGFKSVQLFCDIETLTVNKKAGKEKPSKYHSYTYSLAIAYFKDDDDFPSVAVFNNFVDFFEKVKEKKIRKSLEFEMIFHNGEKFDNHFAIEELSKHFNLPIFNEYNKSLNNEANEHNKKIANIDTDTKNKGCIFESRIKSSNNVSVKAFIGGRKIVFTDSFKKMNTSIKVLGNMLLNNHLITEEYLKTDFDYQAFDKDYDMSQNDINSYVKRCFDSLNEQQLIYIRNDVIILALGVKHYKKLFYGFDFSKMTFTQNIKEEYSQYNKLAEFQLLKTDGRFSHLVLNDYNICGMTGFDYFRSYYKGGLNLYNDAYVGKIINSDGFSIDLNSSYPTVMYKEKLPTFLIAFNGKRSTQSFDYKNDDVFTFFTMTIKNANEQILSHVKSIVIRSAIVKYYNSKNGLVYFNTVFLRLLEKITKHEFTSLVCENFAVFKTEYFGARDVIARNYFIKTQGKMKNKLDCEMDTIDPLNIKMTNTPKPDKYNFSEEMVQGSKVLLNGIYGVPALRIHFDYFKRQGNEFVNIKDGFTNKERNIVFSAGVTAFAFHNLLSPLQYLQPSEIDEYFWYADTDSLYMDKRALAKFPKSMFHKMNLGAWDIEHENITKFYAFNHKKYCLYDDGIVVRAGGISKALIKDWIKRSNDDFEFFVRTFFTDGVMVPSTRSIRNEINTISIYESQAMLEKGVSYQTEYTTEVEEALNKIKEHVRDDIIQQDSHILLYVETPYGTIGINDLTSNSNVSNAHKSINELLEEYKYYMKKG
jgi:hypothetical protein